MTNIFPPDAEQPEAEKKYWTDDPELLEQYILGKLSPEEKAQRDAEIADCEPCRKKLQQETAFIAGIRRRGREEMKISLRKKLREKQPGRMIQYNSIALAAAVVIIAVGIGMYKLLFSDIAAPKYFGKRELIFRQPKASSVKPDEEKTETVRPEEESSATDEQLTASEYSAQHSSSKEQEAQGIRSEENILQGTEREETTPPLTAAGGASAVTTKSIWLVGNIIVQSQNISAAEERSSSQKRITGEMKKEQETVRFKNTVEGITLRQGSSSELSKEQQQVMKNESGVHTLVEKHDDKIIFTIFDAPLSKKEFQHAVVHLAADDSLIIDFPSQTIAYHLPPEWSMAAQKTIRK
ncbi:MAG: hypothetical protein H3C35_08240 [Bacteroidetes bacterium]|nr:hypothetical protein [Bacteroidota bacterium]